MSVTACTKSSQRQQKILKNRKKLQMHYVDIIERRWNTMLKKDLHAAAYWPNSAFQYNKNISCRMSEIMKSIIEVMQKLLVEGMEYMMYFICSAQRVSRFLSTQTTYKIIRIF